MMAHSNIHYVSCSPVKVFKLNNEEIQLHTFSSKNENRIKYHKIKEGFVA